MLDFYRFKHFQKYDTLLHAVTTKSTLHPYAFSLALHTGEEAQTIISNRQTLAKHLKSHKPLHFVVAQQTHSNHVKVISAEKTQGWSSLTDAIEDCDALVTNVPHVALNILTADCVPILLFDPVQRVVAAIHAGWRGTQENIVQKTVEKMQVTFDVNPKDILAGIAPSIGGCCYEVGEDVAEHFFDYPEGFTKKEEKYMLDLSIINKMQLLQSGIQEKHIEMSNICTACEVTRFFSYRKEHGCSGRFMSMIALD